MFLKIPEVAMYFVRKRFNITKKDIAISYFGSAIISFITSIFMFKDIVYELSRIENIVLLTYTLISILAIAVLIIPPYVIKDTFGTVLGGYAKIRSHNFTFSTKNELRLITSVAMGLTNFVIMSFLLLTILPVYFFNDGISGSILLSFLFTFTIIFLSILLGFSTLITIKSLQKDE